jgi:hypothetical protein
MTVGRVKGTAAVLARDLFEMIRKPVQSAHRRAEIRFVAIDRVTLKVRKAVHENLVFRNDLDRTQRLAQRVLLSCRETVAACGGIR